MPGEGAGAEEGGQGQRAPGQQRRVPRGAPERTAGAHLPAGPRAPATPAAGSSHLSHSHPSCHQFPAASSPDRAVATAGAAPPAPRKHSQCPQGSALGGPGDPAAAGPAAGGRESREPSVGQPQAAAALRGSGAGHLPAPCGATAHPAPAAPGSARAARRAEAGAGGRHETHRAQEENWRVSALCVCPAATRQSRISMERLLLVQSVVRSEIPMDVDV